MKTQDRDDIASKAGNEADEVFMVGEYRACYGPLPPPEELATPGMDAFIASSRIVSRKCL